MRNYKITAVVLMISLAMCASAYAQGTQSSGSAPTIASVLDRGLTNIGNEIMKAAEAIPEEKYDFSPASANIPGDFKTPTPVRTIGEQFKHIGDALESYSSVILGEKPPQNSDENGPKNVKSKSDVINYLKASFTKAHSAIDTITAQNAVEPLGANGRSTRLSLAVGMIGHSNNHYGQIIEYLRMNGIVPPESQPQPSR